MKLRPMLWGRIPTNLWGVVLRVIVAIVVFLPPLSPMLTPAPVQASAGLPLGIFDPASTNWFSIRNYTHAQWSADFQVKADAGYMLIDIDIVEMSGQQRVSGVWMKNPDGRGWASRRGLTSVEFSSWWTAYKNDGWRLIDQESYVLDGARYYAGIWMQNVENLAWASWRNLTSVEFTTKFNQYRNSGYIPIDVEGYPYGDSTRYSIIWVKNTGNLAWILYRDMTGTEYGNKFDEYKGRFRVHDIEAYPVGSATRYAAIWYENTGGRAWQAWRDMNAESYANKWLQLNDAGYRLTDFEVYPTSGGWRYAGVWRQNSRRPDWSLKGRVDSLVQSHVDQFDVPGMTVAIAKNGQFLYLRGFGYADIDDNKAASALSTVFRLASVSKAVGGTIGFRLQANGDLDLDDTTRSHVPSMPNHHTHTVGDTLSNRSGIGHYDELGSDNGNYTNAEDALDFFEDEPLVCNPGTCDKYSTHAYTAAGASFEDAAGKTIFQIVNDEITNPFELTTLRPENNAVANPNRATLYDTDNDEVSRDNLTWKVLGGGLEATAYDAARFGIKLMNGSILSAANRTTMWTPPDALSNYAFGWDTGSENGFDVVAKNGAQRGANSYIRMYPEKGIVIVVLSNRQDGGHSAPTVGMAIGALMIAAATEAIEAQEPSGPAEIDDLAFANEYVEAEAGEPVQETGFAPVDVDGSEPVEHTLSDQPDIEPVIITDAIYLPFVTNQ